MSRKTKFRSIRWTIIFLVMGLFAAMGAIMFSFALPMLRNTALDAAKHQAMMVAQEQAGNVAAKLSSAFKIPHVIAGTLKTNKIDNTGLTREQVNKILREQLASNSEIFGVYTAWEPNAYDDKDGEYINKEGHDATGRFVPYWFRNPDNSLGLTALLDYDVEGPGDYYQVPKKTKKNSLIEPYLYNAGGRDVLMTSLIVPIVVDGQFLGMSGVDILLESLQTGVDEINIYDDQATVTIYSNTGLIVAMKGSPEMIGKPLKELGDDSDRVLDIIKSGKSEQYETGGNFSVFAPLIVGDTDTPWSVNITIPLSKVTEVADGNTWQLLVICAVLLILLPLALWWVSGLITSPIKLVAEGAQRLAIGDADMSGIDKNRLANLLKRNDELGLVGNSFTDLIQYFKDTSSAAQSIAGGDLTITIEAKSDEDMLGNAFVQMVKALRETVGQVSQNATNLKTAAEHLSTASVQSGQASNQIAATISQIAKGTTQQTESTTRTAAAVEQLTRAVDGVAHGAQEQSAAINQTSDVLGLLSEAVKSIQHGADQQSEAITHSQGEMKRLSVAMEEIRELSQEASRQLEKTSQTSAGFREALKRLDETAGRVNSVVKSSEQAATNGAEIVSRSTQDMATVQKTSEDLADKVADLGRNAAQMDAILSTIDDIASRTNLLALNAAIEAARAGEHGRGFSVVADEVRKLAEKSTEATKEIAEILRSLQESANATSQSMQQTSEDVARAGQAVVEAHATFQSIVSAASESVASVDAIRTALESLRQTGEEFIGVINSTAQSSQQNQRSAEEMVTLNQAVTQRMNEVTQVAESNLQATRKMVELNNQMIERMDSISAIVEENTASSEEMSASAKSVTEMIENIASVSEENSASVEEVSAGTEEMSAQTEEVSASAQDLNAMAENLSRVVAQFRLAGDEEHLVSTSR